MLEDPLPSESESKRIIEGLVKEFRTLEGFDASADRIDRAADLCRGLTRFATEEAVSRNLTKQGIDLKGLADIQRRIVELATDRGLVYERGLETFEDIGGQASFKQFLQGLFSGPGGRALWCAGTRSTRASRQRRRGPSRTIPASARTCSRSCSLPCRTINGWVPSWLALQAPARPSHRSAPATRFRSAPWSGTSERPGRPSWVNRSGAFAP